MDGVLESEKHRVGSIPKRHCSRWWSRWTIGLLALAVACCVAVSAASALAESEQAVQQWRSSIRVLPLPSRGCFNASYPRVQWLRIACRAAPHHPYVPAQGFFPGEVGNGNDYSAEVPGLITSAIGSFPSVSAGASETGIEPSSGHSEPNTLTLQLNSNFFSTPACAGARHPSECEGWQQFVYVDSPSENEVFMQYWLLRYDKTCPKGWLQFSFPMSTEIYCYENSGSSTLSGGRLTASGLAGTTLEASADVHGDDAVVMTTASGNATATAAGNVLDLGNGWKAAEFAVVGDCCGTQATFSAKTTITVRTVVKSTTEAAPTCVNEGFTGETNNLDLEGTPALSPQPFATVDSQQTNGSTTAASCATYPIGPPGVTITTPPEGAKYTQGESVHANYSCSAPVGETLESCTGTVPNGEPINTTSGSSNTFTVTAKDTDGQTTTVTHTYTLVIGLHVVTSSLPPATPGHPYSTQIEAAGGTEPYKWAKVGKLPKGLKLGKTGLLSGTPSVKLTPGEYPAEVKVTDSAEPKHATATAKLTLTVS